MVSTRIVVVLPAPFGPSRPNTSPGATANDTPADRLQLAEADDEVVHEHALEARRSRAALDCCPERRCRRERPRRCGRPARGSCGARACASRTARPRAWPAPRRGGGPARAGGRCGRAPRSSSSRRRSGSTSSRRSWARTSARASSAVSSVLELLERDAQQLFQAHHLAQALDLGARCRCDGARRGARRRLAQQADLLVVADRPRRRADEPRDVADAQLLLGAGWHLGAAGIGGLLLRRRHRRAALRRARRCRRTPLAWRYRCLVLCRRAAVGGPQQAHARAEQRDGGQHPQGDVHVGDERRELLRRRGPWRGRRRPRTGCAFGIDEVTIASTKAIDSTAPVFCSSVRAPAAMPRRLAGTAPIIAAVLGLLNMPEPTPTSTSHRALCQ